MKRWTAQLKCLYTNAYSMGNKHEDLEALVQLENSDQIAITETWWDELHNWNMAIEGYKLFRGKRTGRRSGGVVLYINEGIDCEDLPPRNSHKQFESLWVKIKDQANKGHLVVGVYCRLPDQGEPIDEALLLQLQEASNSQALLIGDFTHLDICWESSTAGWKQSRGGRRQGLLLEPPEEGGSSGGNQTGAWAGGIEGPPRRAPGSSRRNSAVSLRLLRRQTRTCCWRADSRSPVDERSHTGLSPAKECPHVSSSPGTSGSSFLSGNQGEAVRHDCLETIEATYSSRPDLKDTPLDDAESWFTDESSYVANGKRHAGYAVTTSREVIESRPLPTGTSAQKAEIIALTRALEMAKGKKINIYTNSRYAFEVAHAHGAIWKERGLLTSQGKNIKHAQEIIQLLEAVQLPEKVAVMHIKAHQRVSSELEEGNELADREAKEAAKGEVTIEGALIPDGQISLEGKAEYRRRDRKLIEDQKRTYTKKGGLPLKRSW
ncbi:uncharacterized protein LOC127060954 [Serinus canaria]|uniref:uncharacterized protein LOC127060954 n=1 Tax=Serinus canaria TaxID=9135 RepID=UPI0021CD0BBB|nr:uncharacterized protein LOC127060954 [Serinus canaria]